ncbi:hypothetical protein ACN27F_01255 [Solwaraspora sp. WMMB335]|uniref:hypothetical protein n=1 Tax=Solwaraspora sp. WMMB335 TaxID=3404118 RepID=UPI003B95BA6C
MSESYGHRPVTRRDVVRGAAVGGIAAAAAVGGTFIPESPAAATPAVEPMPAPPAKPVPAASPAPELLGLGNWLGTVMKVANVAAKVLPAVLDGQTSNAIPPPFQVGDLQFEWIGLDGGTIDLYAKNPTDSDIGLSYSVTRSGPDTNLGVYQPIRARHQYKCQADMSTFVDGQVYVAPTPMTTLANSAIGRAVSFATRALSLGAVATVMGGIRVSVNKDPNGATYSATVETTGSPNPVSLELSASDKDGNTVRARWTSGNSTPTPSANITVPLPTGVNLDPVVASLQLLLEFEELDFQQLNAERLGRLIAI